MLLECILLLNCAPFLFVEFITYCHLARIHLLVTKKKAQSCSVCVLVCAYVCARNKASSMLDGLHLVASHSNGSWPRKSKRHLWKKSLNNSPSSTLSTEPHRTTTNRTERGAERACKLGLVGEQCDHGWCWEKNIRRMPCGCWAAYVWTSRICLRNLHSHHI